MNIQSYEGPTEEQIIALKDVLLQGPQRIIRTDHYFADGMYCRVVHIPAGSVFVGRVHKKEHFFIVAKGEVIILGVGSKTHLTAPHVLVSRPGTKRAGYVIEDVTCITVHRTEFTDLALAEADVAEEAPDSPYTTGNILKSGVLAYQEDV